MEKLFTNEQSRSIFQFFLNIIRNKGHIAKWPINFSDAAVWIRCRQFIGVQKDIECYRNHFKFALIKLHLIPYVTLQEKADLYFALDLHVDKSIRQELIDTYQVEINKYGYLTGCSNFEHWIPVLLQNSSAPKSRLSTAPHRRNYTPFWEFEDGLMWKFVLDDINSGIYRGKYLFDAWEVFKNMNARINRSSDTYETRFHRILLPNLHIMPFHVATKAAIYQHLDERVPEDFWAVLQRETGVKLDDEGLIVEFSNRPLHFSLQSEPLDNIPEQPPIDNEPTLMNPITGIGPFTTEEDKMIWKFILVMLRGNNEITKRIKANFRGFVIWKHFVKVLHSKREWSSLRNHFVNNLAGNIMSTDFDLKTKLELYFGLSIPPSIDAISAFHSITTKLITKEGVIQYAVGSDFEFGQKEKGGHVSDEDYVPNNRQIPQQTTSSRSLRNSAEKDVPHSDWFHKVNDSDSMREDADLSSNSVKYPYQPPPGNSSYQHRGLLRTLGFGLTRNDLPGPSPPISTSRRSRGRPRKSAPEAHVAPITEKLEELLPVENEPIEIKQEIIDYDDVPVLETKPEKIPEIEAPYFPQESSSPAPNRSSVPYFPRISPSTESLNFVEKWEETQESERLRRREWDFDEEIDEEQNDIIDPRLDNAFQDIEESIRQFNCRLKNVSRDLGDNQHAACFDRVSALTKMFRATTRDALARK